MNEQQTENEADYGQSSLTNELDTDCGLTLTGAALVDLGKAMQDKNTTIDELAALAFKAGVRLQFRICD